ncbi:MAG: nicotinate (nicotinamide) nucleotide adenylyltransferase [Rhodoferax sp.]
MLNPAGPRRIGVFGSAFDPPHAAHRALVEAALNQLALDRLLLLPTGQAWHKPQPLSAAKHRLAMAQAAFADLPQVAVDAREIDRPGPSYTVDTLAELAQEHPQALWFLVLGADQAQALTTWKHWQTLLSIATLCVAPRADPASADGLFDAEKISGKRFLRLHCPVSNLSATAVRQAIAQGQDVYALVSPAVARYIATHHLYTLH